MRPVLLIAWREYKQYILSQGFLLFLVMFPLLVVGLGAAAGIAQKTRPVRDFVVVDAHGGYASAIDRELKRRNGQAELSAWDAYAALSMDEEKGDPESLPPPFSPAAVTTARIDAFFDAGGATAANAAIRDYLKPGAPSFEAPRAPFRRLPLVDDAPVNNVDKAADFLRPYLVGEQRYPGAGANGLFAAVIVPPDYTGAAADAAAQYWSRNLTDPSLESAIGRALSSAVRREVAASFGIDEQKLEVIANVDAPISSFNPEKEEAGGALSKSDRQLTVIPAILTYMLLVVVFGVGNLLLTNTIEERSNKIVEILLSSVTANQLMIGKLVGIAAVGLTMPAIFLFSGSALALLGAGGSDLMREILIAMFTNYFVPIYLFYFFCAYAIFAMIFIAIGAMSNSLQDAQSFMGPVMLIVFAPMPFMPIVFQNPNGLVATILTWIPVYTPYAVLMRAASNPPLGEIIGATALMLIFALFLARIMGRIFRAAILQSAPVKAKDLIRLARADG